MLAALAPAIAVIMLLAFFEVMFFLEGWVFAKALIGMIAVVALQRFVFKLIISLALTREFKQDSSNIAWWTGKWYSNGLALGVSTCPRIPLQNYRTRHVRCGLHSWPLLALHHVTCPLHPIH